MSSKNETIPLLVALLTTGAVLGGGFLLLKNRCTSGGSFFLCGGASSRTPAPSSPVSSPLPPPPSPREVATFPVPTEIPSGTKIRVDGSTSMVQINSALKQAIERKYAGVSVLTNGRGSDKGIERVSDGSIDIAAISRPLTEAEIARGLVATPIVRDSIAIAIGARNPFSGKLTAAQVKDIFTGKTTKWSEVGGSPTEIRVINRPAGSGTYQTFRSEVLGGAEFGTGPNFVTMPRDATTPILRELGLDGIGYATYAQVEKQKTVRTISIDGIPPGDPNYPFQRTLYYVYKEPANEAVKAFLGFAISREGQEVILRGNEDLQ
ncbi:phosphate ABC transporter substrate-binding protein [Pannus brasiliensis CCIBt3594]|uniref:Phosphate ABC transporter substrate-binding protein n=1 Tax=Pannus brasiliensis CCIBt3594 TaxID=1427578 RepID=A0AAW9QRP4_9CHRO